MFCPQLIYVFCVDLGTNSINLSVFRTEAESVYCAVRNGSLNQTDTVSYLKGYSLTRKTGTLCEDVCTFMIVSCSVHLRMRNVSDKICKKKKSKHTLCSITPPQPPTRKYCRLWDKMKKKNMVEPNMSEMAVLYGAWALHAGYLRLKTHTQNMWYLLLIHR